MPSLPLSRPVKPANYPPLATVEDACQYLLSLSEPTARLNHWQHAAKLCIAASERPSARTIAELTDQLELALMLSFRLDLSVHKKAPALSVRESTRVRRRA